MTLGLFAVVVSLGVPSFGRILAEHRLRVEVDTLFHAIHLARKESIVRRREVTLCPSADGQNCVPGFDWSQGFIMFVNRDRDSPPRRDSDEPLVRGNIRPVHIIRWWPIGAVSPSARPLCGLPTAPSFCATKQGAPRLAPLL
jgi:Tfp pilus assembly protein FimT